MDSTKTMTFIIPGDPKTKLRPRFSRWKGAVRTYDPQSEESNTMKWRLKSRMNAPPLEGPLEVEMKFYMAIPKSTSKKNKEKMISGETKHTKTPDCDNLVKQSSDCMNGVVYLDDKQIYKLTATKLYAESPRTEITVWTELDQVRDLESGQR